MEIKLTLREDGKIDMHVGGKTTYPVITAMLQTAQLTAMEKAVEIAKENDKNITEAKLEELKGQIYDIYNGQASLVLDKFAPEIELRKDLTVEAMIKAENEILDEHKEV